MAQESPSYLQVHPRSLQDGPRRPKRPPRDLQDSPRGLQEVLQKGPKRPKSLICAKYLCPQAPPRSLSRAVRTLRRPET
eukprot:4738929-Pyramimonas_sp.AAC.1